MLSLQKQLGEERDQMRQLGSAHSKQGEQNDYQEMIIETCRRDLTEIKSAHQSCLQLNKSLESQLQQEKHNNVSLNSQFEGLHQELSRLQSEEEMNKETVTRRLSRLSGLKRQNDSVLSNQLYSPSHYNRSHYYQ